MSSSQPPLLENATRDLARFAAQFRYEDIPAEAVDRMKTSVLDSIGCCLYGATLPWTQRVQAMAEAEQEAPVAGLWGSGRQAPTACAARGNRAAGTAVELRDIPKKN